MLRASLPILLLCACSLTSSQNTIVPKQFQGIQVLGVAQDGGKPQAGCIKDCCKKPAKRELVASLGIHARGKWVLIDATPDFAQQIELAGKLPDAIFLTHAHIGHYLGLAQLGREVMGASDVEVWCSPKMAQFLKKNGPWSQLIQLGNIDIKTFKSGEVIRPIDGVSITAIPVPHRDEFSDTMGFSICVNQHRTLYIPDIDSWEKWTDINAFARAHETLILDGTFFDNNDLPGRDMSLIPHPRIIDSMKLLKPLVDSLGLEVIFTHLNHTNPLWNTNSKAYQQVIENGFMVAQTGQLITNG